MDKVSVDLTPNEGAAARPWPLPKHHSPPKAEISAPSLHAADVPDL
jgi:hypothetical protein